MKQQRFTIKLSDVNIEIITFKSQNCQFYRDYITKDPPSVYISVNEKDIEAESRKRDLTFSLNSPATRVKDIVMENGNLHIEIMNEAALEIIASFRKIVNAVLPYNLFLMHGAVISHNGASYMFTAPSGIGKTTHVKLWLENLTASSVINGDKPLIKLTDTEALACGTPWCGKERMGMNTIVPLKAIILMERSENNRIEEISFGQAYPFLLQQTYMPEDPEKAKKTLELLSKLSGRVRIYRFHFNNMKDDCFEVAYKALVQDRK